jgi:hypothetical protein
MAVLALILMIAAIVLLFLAAFNVAAARVSLLALGLALWAVVSLLGGATIPGLG